MNLAAIAHAPVIIQLNTAAAVFAAAFGPSVQAMTNGTAIHRTISCGFAAAILFTAFNSFWISRIDPGHFSAIDILSIATIIPFVLAIYFRRRGNIRGHAISMTMPLAGLLIAGAATLAPGRVMHAFFFG